MATHKEDIPKKREAVFTKIKNIQPAQRYNIAGLITNVSEPVIITRMDESKVKLGTATIGDETALVEIRIKDSQCDLMKKGSSIILRNARSSVVKGHIKMVVDIWGKLELSDKAHTIVECKATKNISDQEYEAKIEDK